MKLTFNPNTHEVLDGQGFRVAHINWFINDGDTARMIACWNACRDLDLDAINAMSNRLDYKNTLPEIASPKVDLYPGLSTLRSGLQTKGGTLPLPEAGSVLPDPPKAA